MSVKKVNVDSSDIDNLKDISFTKAKIPYDLIKIILDKGKVAIVSNISRQTAYYMRKKLSRELGYKVDSIPAKRDGEKVYLFMRRDLYYMESLEDK